MCHSNCGCGSCGGRGGCTVSVVMKVLLIVGAVNWGLVGVGMLMGNDLNVVHMLLGSLSSLEAVVYVLVGVAGVMKIFGCRCSKCRATCASCDASGSKMGGNM